MIKVLNVATGTREKLKKIIIFGKVCCKTISSTARNTNSDYLPWQHWVMQTQSGCLYL
jgi:hypothetical protein